MRILILGAGVSGTAAARLARQRGHAVTVYDEKSLDAAGLLALGVGVTAGSWDTTLLEGVDLVVSSPGFSERSLAVVETLESGTPIWSEIEFAWRGMERPDLVAITGTNGKTTVTRLTTEMLVGSGIEAVAAGNIGTPLSGVVGGDWEVCVVEVSSFQLRFIDRFSPRAAALLNIAEDHLDWHGSAQNYTAAKQRIFERQTDSDLLVYDIDDEAAAKASAAARSILHPVSALRRPQGGSGVEGGALVLPGLEIPVAELGSKDPAHIVDVAIAGVLALDRGATPEAVARSAGQFAAGEHRRQTVGAVGDVEFVNDSKATNPHAALAAISAYPSVVLIAGGLAKGLDLTPLAKAPNVRAVVGIGTAGPTLAKAAGETGRTARSMEEAVRAAAALARPGDTVLLAPGGASFDQFGSYSERGAAFVAAVRSLASDVSEEEE